MRRTLNRKWLTQFRQYLKTHISYTLNKQNIYRLGRIDNAEQPLENQKIGPLRICTNSKDEKWEIVKRIDGLKKLGVFAKTDMNEEERDADFQLYQTLIKT